MPDQLWNVSKLAYCMDADLWSDSYPMQAFVMHEADPSQICFMGQNNSYVVYLCPNI